MRSYSLRLRLLLWAALWICVALLVAGVVIAWLFATNVEARVHQDLAASFSRMAALIDQQSETPALTGPLADPRYDTPLSGLYWQLTDPDTGAIGRSRSLWDFELTLPPGLSLAGEAEFGVIAGPAGRSLTGLFRQVRFAGPDGPRALTVIVAEDRTVLEASIAQFGRDLGLALVALGAGLVAAAWLQVQFGLKPLQSIRRGVELVRQGLARGLDGAFPAEVGPLVAELNHLLRSHESAIEFARARAADLAHGLKTPLAVLATTASDLRAGGQQETAVIIEELARDMADRVDYQLRLSRLHQRVRPQVLSASLNDALERVLRVLKQTREGEQLAWRLSAESDLSVDMDRHDLIELLGVILENAAKWGKSEVSVSAIRQDADALVVIEDDGPGISPEQLPSAAKRGLRLDETRTGSGLGLAIAAEIVALNKGRLEFSRAGRGGLAVTLVLPLSP